MIDLKDTTEVTEGLFIPTWDNKPPYRKPILSINGVSILKFQNISCIIASPGSGKSSVCESILSSVINKDSDTLGFQTDIESVLYIDFERAEEDVWTSFARTMNRANVKPGEAIKNANIISLRNISTAEDRKLKIEELLKHYAPELLLLDGIGDLVNDTNSLEQSIQCKNWVRKVTAEYKVSILTTLHPNKGSLTPRGHIGSEILRESEGVLAITTNSDEVRTLTSDFEHGKARNGGHATTCFKWSDEKNMFTTTDIETKGRLIKLVPEDRLDNEELIQLVKATHSAPLNANHSKVKIKEYLDTNITHVKTSTTDINNFLKYLDANNYLTQLSIGTDKRIKYYKIHVNHE